MQLEVYDSIGVKKGSNLPPQYLLGDELGYVSSTSTLTSGTAPSYSTLGSITVTGDGTNAIIIEGHNTFCTTSSTAVPTMLISSGAAGTGTIYASEQWNYSSTAQGTGLHVYARIPAFTGTQTFYCCYGAQGSGGTASFSAGPVSSGQPIMWFRAYRPKTVAQYSSPACRLYNSTSQTLSAVAGTWTTLALNSKRYDNASMNTVANTITIPTTGIYSFGAAVDLAGNSSNAAGARILLNGTTTIAEDYDSFTGVSGATDRLSSPVADWSCNAGDTVVLQGISSVASQSIPGSTSTTAFQCEMWASYIGPTTTTPAIAGKELVGGYAASSSNTTGITTTPTVICSITVSGDGATPVFLEGSCGIFAAAAATDGTCDIYNSTDAIQVAADRVSLYAVNARTIAKPRIRISAFSGTKTFQLRVQSANSNSVTADAAQGGGNGPAYIRATWAG